MKKILSKLALAVLAAIYVASVPACKEPGFGDFSLSVQECGPDYVDLFLTAPGTIEFAYEISTKPLKTVNPSVLYATGTVISGNPGDIIRLTEGIVQDKTYYLYAVTPLSSTQYSDVIELEFTTKKYQFDETLTVVETYYDGYKIHVTVPESVKKSKNALRYTMASLAVYNKIKNTYGSTETDMLLTNGGAYTRFIKNDSTMVINGENVYELDEKGNIKYDENNEPYDFHDPVAPGEPSIFMVGEYKWGDVKEYGFSFGGVDSTGFDKDKGYFLPLFDWSKNQWQGEFAKKQFLSKEPSPLTANVKIEVPDAEKSCIDAIVYITPDPYEAPTENPDDYGKPGKGVFQYIYSIVDVATYQAMLGMLDGNEDYVQWFLTSYLAMFELGCEANNGPLTINAMQHFTEPLEAGAKYYILLTAMGDKDGTTQRFYKQEFVTKPKTKKAPRIVVTAYPQDKTKPYEASFNVKAPDGDIVGAYFACNAAREFDLMINAGYTYADILKGNYSFSQDEIDKINSKDGYDLSFYTLDGEVTRLAVYGCNDEYTFNNVKVGDKEFTAVADYTAPYAQRTPEVVSSLYDDLSGTWTATATLSAKQLDEETEEYVSYKLKHTSEIVIGKTAPVCPDKVESYVYDLYPKKTKAEVDAMLDVLKIQSDIFTENRLTNRNRLLCTGFMDFDYYKNPGRMDARTPYDLFKATDYSSIDEAQLLNDFGPKWYLEVLEGDKVVVPFNDTLVPPMHSWPGYSFHVGAYSQTSNYFFTKTNSEVLGFPVEISPDKNTITIKPIELLDEKGEVVNYYMNAVINNGGSYELVAPVISDIVLKRKTVSKSSADVQVKGLVSTPVKAQPRNFGGTVVEMPKNKVYKSMTKLNTPIKYKVDEYPNVITTESFNEALDNYIEKHYNIKMK